MSALLILCFLTPLLATLLLTARPLRPLAIRLAPWSALPALGLAVVPGTVEPVQVPWLLLGGHLGADATARVFLLFTALVWTASGVYARSYLAGDEHRARYFAYHLLTLAGNLGLIVAADLANFYLFFSLMTFAAYGLVVHEGGAEALRAGRVYIALSVLGEAMLLAGGLLAAVHAGSLEARAIAGAVADAPRRDLVVALLFFGFGVKAGALPLHFWLPLAHPVAPTPASAVLSGAMIKAGLLGWLRFLPLGVAALPGWGAAVIGLGLAAAFFGAVAGTVQDDPKTVLAYSSISKMGIMTVGVGTGFLEPAAWPAVLAAVTVYATHHALAKGTLFLGVGVARAEVPDRRYRRLVLAGMLFAALAMVGAPLTSGSIAEHYLEEAAHHAPAEWPRWLGAFLPLTAAATTLPMVRLGARLLRGAPSGEHHPLRAGMWLPWAALLLGVAVVVWILPIRYSLGIEPPRLPELQAVRASLWPILLGGLLYRLAPRVSRWTGIRLRVPAGDVLAFLEKAGRRTGVRPGGIRLPSASDPMRTVAEWWYGAYVETDRRNPLLRMELRLTRWSTAVLLALFAIVALFGLLLLA